MNISIGIGIGTGTDIVLLVILDISKICAGKPILLN